MKKNMFTMTAGLILAIVLLISGCGQSAGSTGSANTDSGNTPKAGSGKKITIKINNDLAANTLKGDSWRFFKKQLEAKVGDKVDVQIYDASSLYNQTEQVQALQQNNIQFISPVPGVMTGQFPKLAVFGLPYLFKSPAMIAEAMDNPDISGKIFADLEAKNVKVTSVWLNGWRMLTTRKPVTKMEEMKGMKVRVPAGNNYVDTFKAFGANVVTLNWGEVPSALQQGIIDAVEPTPNANLSDKIYESAPYITNTDHMLDIYLIATNKKWYDGLPADVQKAVDETIEETAKWNWDETTKANNAAVETMVAAGAKFKKLSDEELAVWQKATLPVIEANKAVVGPEIIQELQTMGEKFEWERQ